MSEDSQTWIKQIASISGDDKFQSDVAQIQSKGLLREMNANVPDYNWTYLESIIQRNASAMSFMIESMAEENLNLLKNIGQSTLRLALLWENLARLKEKTNPQKALINAAIAYEIAGYQANASCLAKRVSFSENTNRQNSVELEKQNDIVEMSSLFLQRHFLNLKKYCEHLKTEPENYTDEHYAIRSLAIAITADGFSEICNYFLNGSTTSLDKGRKRLLESENLFTTIMSLEEANIVRSIRSLLSIMQIRSTWNLLGDTLDNPLWERYLKLLARGIGTNLLNSTSISELWPSQVDALKDGLLLDTYNKIIKMPTSAGKTRIAELAIAHTLINNKNAKCIYVAPYRALVAELEETFLNIFGDLGFNITTIVGTYEIDPFEQQLAADADILVVTPEKLDLLLRADSDFLNNVQLFILDEGHIIKEKKRGIKFELLLTRLKRKLTNTRFLFLSAVLSSETINEFLQWFNSEKSGLIKSDWRPSIQRYARLEWNVKKNGVLRYAPSNENKLLDTFVSGVISEKKYKILNRNTGRINTVTFPNSSSKSSTAAELAFKFSELGPVLVFCTQIKYVDSVANSLLTRIELIKNIGIESIPPYFQERNSRSAIIASELLGDGNQITKLLKNGIAIHHADLPDVLRRAIEIDFRERQFQTIIATSTLAQGVNLPIRTVIIHSCRRYVEDESIPISISDYWNIAGRAGRAGQETEGTIIHIVNSSQDRDDYFYYLKNRETLEPTFSALFKLLLRLIEDGISDEEKRELLDPEILALLAEENNLENLENKLKEILDESLVSAQASKNDKKISYLHDAFGNIARIIASEIPEVRKWKPYSMTGLSATSCQNIQQYVENNKTIVKDLINSEDTSRLPELLSILLESLINLSEMQPKNDYSEDYLELLLKWISGKNINEILSEIPSKEPLRVVKFIEEYFGYLLPWGISGFLQIAKYVLDMDEESTPNNIKYLSTMVKFGVPTAESSWAMMIGIPFKKTAIRMSSKYLQEVESVDYENFRNWISKINSEELIHEYNLGPLFLEGVSKALFRAGTNPLLNEETDVNKVINELTMIMGISYESRYIVAYTARKGNLVDLKRDYDNVYDRNAIKVYLYGKELGFLNRNLAQFLAPHIDCGLNLQGEITEILSERIPQIKIQITKKT